MRVTILGCGSSSGVPFIGCDCEVCRSDNPKNKRLRASIFIETGGLNLLVDTSPDLRQQALANDLRRVDAVLYTHPHADHVHGIDDLRSFNYLSDKAIPIYANDKTIAMISNSFPYLLVPKAEKIWYKPWLLPNVLPDKPVDKFVINSQEITVFQQNHGKSKSLGYRIGDFAYSTDVDALPEEAFGALGGLDIWVVDCLRYTQSHGHSHLEQTLGWIKRVKPKLAVLTHMAHEFEYDKLSKELPDSVLPAYDGMVLEL